MEKTTELKLEGKLENLPKIGKFLTATMERFNIEDPKAAYAVQLSVDEAATNVIKHAYSEKVGMILLRCKLSGDAFIVEIVDWGKPFDPTTIPDPNVEIGLDERKVGGLGIFFMKKFMDEVKYVRINDMNLLTLAKNIKK